VKIRSLLFGKMYGKQTHTSYIPHR